MLARGQIHRGASSAVSPLTPERRGRRPLCASLLLVLVLGVFGASCKKKSDADAAGGSGAGNKTSIQNIGSDTMVNLAAAWAEARIKAVDSLSSFIPSPCAKARQCLSLGLQ